MIIENNTAIYPDVNQIAVNDCEYPTSNNDGKQLVMVTHKGQKHRRDVEKMS